jgi:hypothetical protein
MFQGFQYFSSLQAVLIINTILLKSGGTKDHFRQIKVPGIAPY